MTKSHFQLVGEFHDKFGHPQCETLFVNCFDEQPTLVLDRLGFMREELGEFKVDYKKDNPVMMADALCDLAYFAHGTGQTLGINVDDLLSRMDIDINSDHTKLGEFSNPNTIAIKRSIIDDGIVDIENELEKFHTAAKNKDLYGITVSLALIIKNTYDLGHELGFNMDKMFREVHRANMTKLCYTYEEAAETVDYYVKEGRYKKPAIRDRGDFYVVFDDTDDKKILKNNSKAHRWQEPNLHQFFA